MFKFVLKTTLVSAVAAGALAAAFGPHTVADWIHTSKTRVTEQLNDFQGMTAELNRIESRVTDLDEEIVRLKENVMREEMKVEDLQRDIRSREQGVESLRGNLEKAGTLLDSELKTFKIRGITYRRDEIESDVAEKMRLYGVQRDTLKQLRQTLASRTDALALARENVNKGQSVRAELVAKVDLLQAEVEKLKAREVYAEAIAENFDAQEFNTEIGEARQMLAKFERKLAVKHRMLDSQMRVAASGNPSGIDYTAQAEAAPALREELARLLNDEVVPSQSTEYLVHSDN